MGGQSGRPQDPGNLPGHLQPSSNPMPHVRHLLEKKRRIWQDGLPYSVDRFAHLVGRVGRPSDLRGRREALVQSLRPRVCHLFYNENTDWPGGSGVVHLADHLLNPLENSSFRGCRGWP